MIPSPGRTHIAKSVPKTGSHELSNVLPSISEKSFTGQIQFLTNTVSRSEYIKQAILESFNCSVSGNICLAHINAPVQNTGDKRKASK